jgi:hypothetical protein
MLKMEKPVCPMCREPIEFSEEAQKILEEKKMAKMRLMMYANLFRNMENYYYLYLFSSEMMINNMSEDS